MLIWLNRIDGTKIFSWFFQWQPRHLRELVMSPLASDCICAQFSHSSLPSCTLQPTLASSCVTTERSHAWGPARGLIESPHNTTGSSTNTHRRASSRYFYSSEILFLRTVNFRFKFGGAFCSSEVELVVALSISHCIRIIYLCSIASKRIERRTEIKVKMTRS